MAETLLAKALATPCRKPSAVSADGYARIRRACELRGRGATKTTIGAALGVSRERARQYLEIAARAIPDIYGRAENSFRSATARPPRLPAHLRARIGAWLFDAGYIYCTACAGKGRAAVKPLTDFSPGKRKNPTASGVCHQCLNERMRARYRRVVNPNPIDYSARIFGTWLSVEPVPGFTKWAWLTDALSGHSVRGITIRWCPSDENLRGIRGALAFSRKTHHFRFAVRKAATDLITVARFDFKPSSLYSRSELKAQFPTARFANLKNIGLTVPTGPRHNNAGRSRCGAQKGEECRQPGAPENGGRLMTAPSRKETILRELAKGPVTASELGAILGLPMRICSAWLGMFRCTGVVEVTGTRQMGNRQSNIYALPGAAPVSGKETRSCAKK